MNHTPRREAPPAVQPFGRNSTRIVATLVYGPRFLRRVAGGLVSPVLFGRRQAPALRDENPNLRESLSPGRYACFILIFVMVGLILTSSCKNIELNSTWTSAPILIDGQAHDWSGVTSHFFEESEASVAFANDSSRLNILLRTRDPRLASSIRRSGLMFWINAQGQQEKDFVLRYRGGPSREEMRSMIGGEQRREMDRESEFMTPDTGKATLTCFVKDRIVEMEIPANGSTGPAAAFSLDKGFFSYEFSLPLHESAVRSYGLAAVPGQTIRIGAAWGGDGRGMNSDLPVPGGMKMRPPGGTGGGFGGSGGGRGGGRRADRSQKRPQPVTEQNVQMLLKLAESKGT